jgi:[acyl-carrier-protein] S-malonyltransferase
MKRAFVFPGQGSQAVGMGRGLAEAFQAARDLFAEVDEMLSQPLSRLMFEGPESDLTLTENAQPALLAASLAVIRVLESEGGLKFGRHVVFVAGHSLGEYSALAAARAVTVADAVRLVKLRGRTMQRAVPVGAGAMAALLGLDIEAAREVAVEAVRGEPHDVCAVANDNAPGQVVVSGHRQAIERAIAIARERGARSVILPVSAPFHSSLMSPAAEVMKGALDETELHPPLVPLVANLSASAISHPGEIKHQLVGQVTAMVRWRESMRYLKTAEVEEVAEIGSGRVLTGLSRRIDPALAACSVSTAAEVDAFMKML